MYSRVKVPDRAFQSRLAFVIARDQRKCVVYFTWMLKLTIQQRLREPFLDQPMVCFDGLVAVVRRLHRSGLAVTVSTVRRLHFSNQLGPFPDLLPAVLKRKPQRYTHKSQNDAIDFHPFSCLTGFARKVTRVPRGGSAAGCEARLCLAGQSQ